MITLCDWTVDGTRHIQPAVGIATTAEGSFSP